MKPLIGSLLLALCAAPALAQSSNYGCEQLEAASPTAVIEGRDGVFFRLSPDLRMNHPVSDGSIELLSEFSRELAAHGTTLIFVPLPTKGLAMPWALPERAADYGFEYDIAAEAFVETIARLRAAGVTTVDAYAPLLALDAETPPFISTDFHWSTYGARAVAEAVGETIRTDPNYAGLDKVTYETRSIGWIPAPPTFRQYVQAHCTRTLPMTAVEGFETRALDSAPQAGGGIFAASVSQPSIVLVGTSMSQTPQFNFDGFLADAASLEVTNLAIAGGNQFGSILSYLMTREFQENPPRYLVWESPVYNNLGEFGALPLREMSAVAADRCVPLEVANKGDGLLAATLDSTTLMPDSYVLADAGTNTARSAAFQFITEDGLSIRSSIVRGRRWSATSQFYLYAAPLWEPGVTHIDARFDRPVGPDASLAICNSKETLK